jgi:hypothetical protein
MTRYLTKMLGNIMMSFGQSVNANIRYQYFQVMNKDAR